MTKDYDTLYPPPPHLPPKGHPRVYFTKADIPRILENKSPRTRRRRASMKKTSPIAAA